MAGDPEIRKAFDDAAKDVGKSLGNNASVGLQTLYKKCKTNISQITKDAKDGEEERANQLKGILSDMKANAGRTGSAADKAEAQTGLFKKFKSILDPGTGAEADKTFSNVLHPPGEGGVPWIGTSKTDGVKLGSLDDDSVVKDGNGLITHVKVNGNDMPVDDYMKNLADERTKMYQDAKDAGTFTKDDTGAAIAVGIDRRTGSVYEGINGRSNQIIPKADQNATLQGRVNNMVTNQPPGGYTWRDGSNGHNTIGDDDPYGHAEVKAANGMLNERMGAGLNSGNSAIGEMSFAPMFPFLKSAPAATCPNCSHILDGASLPHGMRRTY